MDKRFLSYFGLSQEKAIAILDTPEDQLEDGDSRYVAACELVNYNNDASIAALTRAIEISGDDLDTRIVRRKAIETLGRLNAAQTLPIIGQYLDDDDSYTAENAVWATGEIGTEDPQMLEAIARLLDKPKQSYRVVIQTLAKLRYQAASDRIRAFFDHEDSMISSAALGAVAQLTGDRAGLDRVVGFLHHPNVYTRRLAIQDLVDARHYEAAEAIAKTPVSLVFRLRGLRLLADAGVASGALSLETVLRLMDQIFYDHPQDLALIHRYDRPQTLESLIKGLYQTDFGQCYLATLFLAQPIPEPKPSESESGSGSGSRPTEPSPERFSAAERSAALRQTYGETARADYGGHYHVMKLWGWTRDESAIELLLKEGLNNPQPQFQKSRFAAALALADLGRKEAIAPLKTCLDSPIWTLRYAALMALEKLGDRTHLETAVRDRDWLIQARAQSVQSAQSSL